MWMDEYEKWASNPNLPMDLKEDLEGKTLAELEERFFSSLEFGTGGMRGILGAGLNRLNIYTIRKANDGLARYLVKHYSPADLNRGVVIAHDNRRYSREFALESAKVLGVYGIKSYLFPSLRPTPELSYATRTLKAISGIVITASHNPPNYNGYKIYDEYGCQYTPQYATEIVALVNKTTDVFRIPTKTLEELRLQGLLEVLDETIDTDYLAMVKSIQLHPEIQKPLKIVFTPLHGTSAVLGQRLLKETGYDVTPVESQLVPDPFFSTVTSPNPENPKAFELARALGDKIGAELLIATDPDADRLGIVVKDSGDYHYLSGNQTGAILINYLLSEKKRLGLLPKKGVVFNTIVTSELGAKIARSFGFEVVSTLTGFKFIGEQARLLEGTDKKFLFGYEESFGYVVNDAVRDKDALQAMLLASEAANFYHLSEGKTLVQKLMDLYQEFGFHSERLESIELVGLDGKKRINRIMAYFHAHTPTVVASIRIKSKADYLKGVIQTASEESPTGYPSSDVVKYTLEDDSWFVLRPSGTEPKLKVYVAGSAESLAKANQKTQAILLEVKAMIDAID
ncbi:MAG: phospho-sugar mutase [Candidatus Izemoplasmatales bacterium]|nr:phospho-sugar mutase [Candidatus Izemoplasmatales bacterium]